MRSFVTSWTCEGVLPQLSHWPFELSLFHLTDAFPPPPPSCQVLLCVVVIWIVCPVDNYSVEISWEGDWVWWLCVEWLQFRREGPFFGLRLLGSVKCQLEHQSKQSICCPSSFVQAYFVQKHIVLYHTPDTMVEVFGRLDIGFQWQRERVVL